MNIPVPTRVELLAMEFPVAVTRVCGKPPRRVVYRFQAEEDRDAFFRAEEARRILAAR